MPTLMRILSTLALVAGVVVAAMAALVYLVEPTPRRVVLDVPVNLSAPKPAQSIGGGAGVLR